MEQCRVLSFIGWLVFGLVLTNLVYYSEFTVVSSSEVREINVTVLVVLVALGTNWYQLKDALVRHLLGASIVLLYLGYVRDVPELFAVSTMAVLIMLIFRFTTPTEEEELVMY